MRKCIFLVLALITGTMSYAQSVNVGPKVGFSSSKLTMEEADLIRSGASTIGFHAGAFIRISFVGLYLQPEVLFTSSGGRIEVRDQVEDTFEEIQELNYNKIDVPIMIGAKLGDVLRINAGPTFSYILREDARSEGAVATTQEVSTNYQNATVGYQLGIGLDIGKIVIDARYEDNLSKLGDSVRFGNKTFETDYRNSQYTVSLGFMLF